MLKALQYCEGWGMPTTLGATGLQVQVVSDALLREVLLAVCPVCARVRVCFVRQLACGLGSVQADDMGRGLTSLGRQLAGGLGSVQMNDMGSWLDFFWEPRWCTLFSSSAFMAVAQQMCTWAGISVSFARWP